MLSDEQLQRYDAHAEQILDGHLKVHEVSALELAGMVSRAIATIRELQARAAELETEVRAQRAELESWKGMFACYEESDRDCKTGVPLLTHEEVFGVAPIPSETDGMPKGEP